MVDKLCSLRLVVNMRDEHNSMRNIVSVARPWCTGSDLILFIRALYSLPGGGGLGPDFGGSRPVLVGHTSEVALVGTRMPLRQFVTAAHLHRLGFAPFFFLSVHT